ncbi:MAG: type II secretion system protein [Pseudomonadales bacterium]
MNSRTNSEVRETTSVVKALQNGFTLVELLIVVIILAILAAIVVPQFSASTDDAKLSALDSNLAALRSSINYYYQQHGEYPGTNSSALGGLTCGTAPAGSTTALDPAVFVNQLTNYTANEGQACALKLADFDYGPYLRKMPENPVTGSSAVRITSVGALVPVGAATPAGWLFDAVSGRIVADDAAHDDR